MVWVMFEILKFGSENNFHLIILWLLYSWILYIRQWIIKKKFYSNETLVSILNYFMLNNSVIVYFIIYSNNNDFRFSESKRFFMHSREFKDYIQSNWISIFSNLLYLITFKPNSIFFLFPARAQIFFIWIIYFFRAWISWLFNLKFQV
jgi:hypothetical protein